MTGAPKGIKTLLKSELRWDWLIVIVISAGLFVSYIYWDLIITTLHSMGVWDALKDGQIFNYYTYNKGVSPSNEFWKSGSPYYGFGVYLIMSIWNLPTWILQRFCGIDVFSNQLCLFYIKGISVFFLVLSCREIKKLCVQLGLSDRDSSWASLLLASSAFVFSGIYTATQYDIIIVFFMLVGLRMYLKNDMKKFVLFFAIAVTFKYFALFAFVF